MEVDWYVDPEFQAKSWGEIKNKADEASGLLKDASLVVDLGGGSGWFGTRLAKNHPQAKVVSVDITPKQADNYPQVRHIKGSALEVPVKEGNAQFVGAHAILHHVPDDLQKCIVEVDRILEPDGIFIAHEPLADNCFASMARKFVRTSAHEEGERPLSYSPRIPKSIAGIGRKIAFFFLRFDKKVLANMPKTRKYAAYVHIVARKQ
jgi:ubiquinone/menaquinone biosynthesis C-methylase UbiE